MEKILSVSVLPGNGLFSVFSEDDVLYKTPVFAVACIHLVDEDGYHSIDFRGIDESVLAEGYLNLDTDAKFDLSGNFKGLLSNDEGWIPLTDAEIRKVRKLE